MTETDEPGGRALERRTIAVLGSTGSIGTQTLDVIAAEPERFEVVALSANSSLDALVGQIATVHPALVVVRGETERRELLERLESGPHGGPSPGDRPEVLVGPEGLVTAAAGADIVVNGVVGFAGLHATLAALRAGRRLALANKESIIAGGPLVRIALETPNAHIVPVDSEHSALHQCLRSGSRKEVHRLWLTASGGPFRTWSDAALDSATVEDALAHPTWSMGPKISVDSSTLMNKGLELIEAHELFNVPYEQLGVVVHPQSIVHSMVEFRDGSVIAQLSHPDMRLPIAYALSHPERSHTSFGALDWVESRRLDFEPPDRSRFVAIDVAINAGLAGGLAPAWLNASNEVAVSAFLEGRITWRQIMQVVAESMERYGCDGFDAATCTVDEVVEVDRLARKTAGSVVEQFVAP